MQKETFYVKSLEEDFATKTLKGTKKATFQTIENIIKTRTIKPNTKSFGRKQRLACTILHKNYLKTYRPQGIIFQTKQKPNHIFPFDLVVLGATENIIVQYYRIRNNLHLYYNHQLIEGFERFVFKDFRKMLQSIPSPKAAWLKVNKFRTKNGYSTLPRQKHRLVEYNEAVFNKKVKINPIAIFGFRKEARTTAKKLCLPHYNSAKEFYEKVLQKR
ncbi:MAG: hypothetical protein WCW44_00395 [archaeon]|jgi:hypothetical protein